MIVPNKKQYTVHISKIEDENGNDITSGEMWKFIISSRYHSGVIDGTMDRQNINGSEAFFNNNLDKEYDTIIWKVGTHENL